MNIMQGARADLFMVTMEIGLVGDVHLQREHTESATESEDYEVKERIVVVAGSTAEPF